MKQIITTIAAVLVVGCGPSVDIHKAAYDRNIEAVKQAIDDGADLNAKGRYGATPLLGAVNNSQKEIVELLIANGADVNAKADDGWTPLHSAAHWGHKEIAELLINKGANVNAKGSKQKETPLYTAASAGHREVAELLIDKGADVNAKRDLLGLQLTPLYAAVELGHKEVVELLIAKGADVNGDMGGSIPLDHVAFMKSQSGLDLATINGLTEIANLLRKHGGKTGAELKAEGK